ncbi:hypothetical protein BB559_006773 [Furculomyces boomerangus]|uniref:Pescadillo homolog n=2 Tax=Harpellales TaxID=61421 RepID=A0A2T9Y0M7_9FUNG|nr:hypothetical protein BB559_006773 [Furculomyces boomerangus]PWA02764.1 hypothetical protein BB558_001061 [Smittium angustum]
MGKLKKAGKEGAAIRYINRNRAVKKLQISLSSFRRLCILKGIYPVEPKNRKKINKGSSAPTTFYYTKDIQYLTHEPLLIKFREHKIFKRKLHRAISKNEWTRAKIISENKPKYKLDHLIIERYPTFIDALRDLDDALSMTSLFALMPATNKTGDTFIINECRKLIYEFMHYVMLTGKLKKTFLSIKGIYYQVEIKGQTITWISPYEFTQSIPGDVDFKVMWTFMDFYRSLIGFVNCKLYKDENLIYPPKIDQELDSIGVGLGAVKVTDANSEKLLESLKQINEEENIEETPQEKKVDIEMKKKIETLAEKIQSIENESTDTKDSMEIDRTLEDEKFTNDTDNQQSAFKSDLFKNFVFYLSREVPKYSLEFIIRSFGGKVCWDGYFNGTRQPSVDASDKRINLYVVDRPKVPPTLSGPKRVFIQPQFIYDSVNANVILSFDRYSVGKKLPPHLSPFVEYREGDYVPKQQLEIDEYARRVGASSSGESVGVEKDDHQAELEAEFSGVKYSNFKGKKVKGQVQQPAEIKAVNDEKKRLAMTMMTKKNRKLYARMQKGIETRTQKANMLNERRILAEKAQKTKSKK